MSTHDLCWVLGKHSRISSISSISRSSFHIARNILYFICIRVYAMEMLWYQFILFIFYLQERLLGTLQPEEIDKILRSFGWTPPDLARGYMIQVRIYLKIVILSLVYHLNIYEQHEENLRRTFDEIPYHGTSLLYFNDIHVFHEK